MRVVTSYGLGEVNDIEWKGGVSLVTVNLDRPFLEQERMEMGRGNLFAVSDQVLVRVIRVAARGVFSNMQFHPSKESAEAVFHAPLPPDETLFLIDLKEGRFKVSGDQDFFYDRSAIIRPWIDRWALERFDIFPTASDARRKFREEQADMSGTTGGVCSLIHLDGRWGGTVLGFFVAVSYPAGIVIRKEFGSGKSASL